MVTINAYSLDAYPTHWWVGMKSPKVQIMVHQTGIGNATLKMENYPGVKLIRTIRPENKNYVFIDLNISADARPGEIHFNFNGANGAIKMNYTLKKRNGGNGSNRIMGVTSKDLIYLLMPDRFSNGDVSNDVIKVMNDQHLDRNDPFSRHGGDLKGIANHLDYLKDLGITAIWMNPVIENDMPLMNEWGHQVAGYHGYWFTDHYNIDRRLGGNEAYKNLVNDAHQKGLKVIQDAVYNHVGNHHWFILDLPMKDWLNNWKNYQGSNHKEEVFFDPYVNQMDKDIMIGGWFVPHLPDLNVKNPFLANYLIQHAIWSTEEFGIDGWRVDTYKYCDEQFMNNINAALQREFPQVTIFGESWCNSPLATAYFTPNNLQVSFHHNLPGVTDFPISYGMKDAADQKNGVEKLYSLLAQDFLYKNPLNNCIFLDNHDMDRIFSVLGDDVQKMKTAVGLLLTLRGIPQLYYGTEILMKNFKNPSDAEVRRDFPGGWNDDPINKFNASGRSGEENQFFEFVKKLANFRKTSSALQTGKTMHYQPQDNVYVYFRYDNNQKIMCIVNADNSTKDLKLDRFSDHLSLSSRALDVLSDKQMILNTEIKLEPKSIMILELEKTK